ncbi:bacteriophage-like membrane protein [Mycolicibacterium phlei]|uniref:phage tail protein n=1 Tax=Mycobacteroides chelonae TaxID=1774 RepID=UPI0006969264|nr:hypothetical protein [Mycobacteroides chelonae]ANA99700.1 tail protein [Mycobacteroides chelonae CCUG 47445]OLT82485.1 hypothetical protein BKG56_10575 [Mycobacteroides chelonae]ORV16051.1 hypothetical protein AWB96_08670 [Mycobacteroides chelonae]VEG19461.1 bacteriophage-like membrane protein [Mycolicibacterium phlei]
MADSADGKEVGRVSVRVVPNTNKFRQRLKEQLEEVEKSEKADINVGLDFDPNSIVTKLRATLAKAQAQVRDLKVGVDVDKSQLFGAGFSKSIAGLGESAGSASSAMAGLGRNGAIVAAVMAAAAPAVGLVSGLLAGLPSLALGAGVGIGAIALGMDGIKTAAKQLIPEFSALKTSVSGVFEQRLTPMFDQLRAVFPVLQSGMQSVAGGMSDMFQGVTDALTSGQGIGQIQTILGQTGAFLSGLQPTVNTFAQSFLTLGSAGAQQFGLLNGVLGTFAGQFDDMANRITSNGAFNGAMQGMSQVLGSLLTQFTRIMEVGVQAMGSLGGPLSNMVNGIGDLFTAMMPGLTSFSGVIADVIGSLGKNLAPIFTALTPAIQAFHKLLGPLVTGVLDQLGPVLANVASALNSALLPAFEALQPVIPQLVQALGVMAQNVGQLLTTAIQQIAPLLPQLVQGFVSMVPAVTSFMTAAQPLVSLLIAATGAVLGLAVAVAGKVVGAINAMVGAIASVITKVSEWVASVSDGVNQVTTYVSELPGKIKAALGNLGTLLFDAGRDLVQGFINGIGSMITGAVTKARELGSAVTGAVKSFLGIHSPSRVMADLGGHTGQGFIDGLASKKNGMVSAAKDLVSGVTDEFGNIADFGKKGVDIGANFAKANFDQFKSDVGIGGGAFSTIAEQGLGWAQGLMGNSFTFNVSNIDDAIRVKTNQLNRQALQWNGA